MTTESLRAFAARKGNAVSYWHGQKTRGRLVMVDVGGKQMVDVEASEALLATTADPGKAYMADVNAGQRAAARQPAPAEPAEPPADYSPQATGGGTQSGKNVTYMQAKTAQQVYDAKLAQLTFEEKTRKLLRADEVQSHLASKIAAMREAFLQIPSRLVPILVAETDAGKIHTLLEDEIVRAMALVNEGTQHGRA